MQAAGGRGEGVRTLILPSLEPMLDSSSRPAGADRGGGDRHPRPPRCVAATLSDTRPLAVRRQPDGREYRARFLDGMEGISGAGAGRAKAKFKISGLRPSPSLLSAVPGCFRRIANLRMRLPGTSLHQTRPALSPASLASFPANPLAADRAASSCCLSWTVEMIGGFRETPNATSFPEFWL